MIKRICIALLALGFAGILSLGCVFVEKLYFYMQNPPYYIQTGNKTVLVYLEKADTQKKQEIGLMYRRHMDSNMGMIFPFLIERTAFMWMKNTYIPLDMMFYDEQHEIRHIHLNARPFDETIIKSPMPVSGVIEVNAGFVEQNNISIGDKIIFPPQ